MTPDRLSEIEARLASATPGPWEVDAGGYVCTVNELPVFGLPERYRYEIGGQYRAPRADIPNMELIAHAPTDIALLLRLVRTARRHLGNISRSVGNPEEYALGVLNEMDAILAEAERIKKGEG